MVTEQLSWIQLEIGESITVTTKQGSWRFVKEDSSVMKAEPGLAAGQVDRFDCWYVQVKLGEPLLLLEADPYEDTIAHRFGSYLVLHLERMKLNLGPVTAIGEVQPPEFLHWLFKSDAQRTEVSRVDKPAVLDWQRGRVVSFNNDKGFGFVTLEGDDPECGKDIFVHFSAIEGSGYKGLNMDEVVEVADIRGEAKGRRAYKVRIIERKDLRRTGRLRRIGDKYGFITADDGKEYYFQLNDLPKVGKRLRAGDQVSFEPYTHKRGLAARAIALLTTKKQAQGTSDLLAEIRQLEELW